MSKSKWSLAEACRTILGFDESVESDARYYKMRCIAERHTIDTYPEYAAKNCNYFYNIRVDYSVTPELFIDWAYSEGYDLDNAIVQMAEDKLERPLKRYDFGRYESFYPFWLKKDIWSSNQALSLIGCSDIRRIDLQRYLMDSRHDPRLKEITAYHYFDMSIAEDMKDAVRVGKLEPIPQSPHLGDEDNRIDAFHPKDVMEWAINHGHTPPDGLLVAYNKPISEKIDASKYSIDKRGRPPVGTQKAWESFAGECKLGGFDYKDFLGKAAHKFGCKHETARKKVSAGFYKTIP